MSLLVLLWLDWSLLDRNLGVERSLLKLLLLILQHQDWFVLMLSLLAIDLRPIHHLREVLLLTHLLLAVLLSLSLHLWLILSRHCSVPLSLEHENLLLQNLVLSVQLLNDLRHLRMLLLNLGDLLLNYLVLLILRLESSEHLLKLHLHLHLVIELLLHYLVLVDELLKLLWSYRLSRIALLCLSSISHLLFGRCLLRVLSLDSYWLRLCLDLLLLLLLNRLTRLTLLPCLPLCILIISLLLLQEWGLLILLKECLLLLHVLLQVHDILS